MNKNKNKNKNITSLVYSGVMLILVLLVLFLFFRVAQRQSYDGIKINLAGRQRMLTQKISKEVLLYSIGELPKAKIEKTQKVFNLTIDALSEGGYAPLDLELNDFEKLPGLNDVVTKKQLDLVLHMNETFHKHVSTYLRTRSIDSMDYIIKNNVNLLNEMDKAVVMMQNTSEKNTIIINIAFGGCLLLIFLFFSLFLIKKMRKLKKDINKLKEIGNFLPICAQCKKIRFNNKTPENPASWMTIEEHLATHEEVLLSHGICPECLDKHHSELKKYQESHKKVEGA